MRKKLTSKRLAKTAAGYATTRGGALRMLTILDECTESAMCCGPNAP